MCQRPAEGESWDVSMLLAGLSARVCQRDTVLGFLNAASMLVHGVAFEQQDSKPEHSAAGLLDLLLFADAVGSSRGLLSALDESAAAAAAAGKLTAQVSRAAGAEKETLELSLACGHYFSKSNPLLLRRYAEGSTAAAVSVFTAADEDERAAVQRQVADLLEPLLHITYRCAQGTGWQKPLPKRLFKSVSRLEKRRGTKEENQTLSMSVC